jgi:hypothetical protein
MRLTIRLSLFVVLGAVVCTSPAAGRQGARGRVLGTVAQADRARLAGVAAQAGANVYACEVLETDDGGVMRVQVGTSQIYLSAISATQLEGEFNEIRAHIIRGTLAFSSPSSSNFSLETPAGILRAEGGQSVAGQVIITGPHEMVVSASNGDLLLDTWGEFRSIPEGKSARIEFGSTLEVTCTDRGGGDAPQQVRHPYAQRKIVFYLLPAAAVGLPSYFLWRNMTESDSTP